MPAIHSSPQPVLSRLRLLCAAPLLASLLLAGCTGSAPAPVDESKGGRPPATTTTAHPRIERAARPPVHTATLRKDLENALRDVPDNRIELQPEGVRVSLPAADGFASNRADIKPALATLLQRIAPVFNLHQGADITIVGHTDAIGSEMHNLRLSIQRAEAVAEYLRNLDVALDRMSADGRGEAEPIADNKTPEGRARNRRVEFFLKQR